MGDDNAGRPRLMQDGDRLLAHSFCESWIEPGEGLVYEEHARRWRDDAGKGHALLLASGEDVRVLMGVMRESRAGERGKRLGIRLAAGQRPEPKGHVLQDAQMREEGEVLEHQPDATLLRRNEVLGPRHLLAVEQHAP
jgi:hypothetical protein